MRALTACSVLCCRVTAQVLQDCIVFAGRHGDGALRRVAELSPAQRLAALARGQHKHEADRQRALRDADLDIRLTALGRFVGPGFDMTKWRQLDMIKESANQYNKLRTMA